MPTRKNLKKVNLLESFKHGGLVRGQGAETIPTSGIKPITYYDMLNAAYPGQYEFTTNTQKYYGDEPTINPRTQTITSNQIPFQYDFVLPKAQRDSYHSNKFLMPPIKGTNDRPQSDKFEEKIRSNKGIYLDKDNEIIARNIVDNFLEENIQDIIENPSEYYLTDIQPSSYSQYLIDNMGKLFSGDISDFLETKPGMPEAKALYLKRYYDDSYEGMSNLWGYDNWHDEISGRQGQTALYFDYDSESEKPYRGEVYERLFDLSPVGIAGGRLFELAYRPGYTQHDVTTTEARLKAPVFTKQEEFEFDRDKFLEDMAERDERQRMLSQNFLIDYLEKEPSRAGKTYYYYDDDEGNILYATGQPRFGTQGNQTGEEQEYLRQFGQFTNKDGSLRKPKVISSKDNPKKFQEVEDRIYDFAYENIDGSTPTFQGQSDIGGGIMRKDLVQPQEENTNITKSMDGRKLKRVNLRESFKQGGTVLKHQNYFTADPFGEGLDRPNNNLYDERSRGGSNAYSAPTSGGQGFSGEATRNRTNADAIVQSQIAKETQAKVDEEKERQQEIDRNNLAPYSYYTKYDLDKKPISGYSPGTPGHTFALYGEDIKNYQYGFDSAEDNIALSNKLRGIYTDYTGSERQEKLDALRDAQYQRYLYNPERLMAMDQDIAYNEGIQSNVDMDFGAGVDNARADNNNFRYQMRWDPLLFQDKKLPYKNINYNSLNSQIHNTLGTFGMVPVFGEPFNLLDAGLYHLEDDKFNRNLSLASAVPFVGNATGATQLFRQGLNYGKNFSNLLRRGTSTAPSLNFLRNYKSGRNILGTRPRSGYVDAYTLDGVQTIPKDKAMLFNRIEDANVTNELMDKGAYETGNWFESQPRAFYNEKVKTVGTFGDDMTLLNPSDKRRAIMGYMDEGTYDAFNVARSTDVAKDMSGGFGFPIAETEMVFPPSLTNAMRDQNKGRFFKTTIGNQKQVADDLFDMYYNKPTIKQAGGTVGRHQDISTIKKSDIVLPGRRNIHTGDYVQPAEGIDPTTYISDALNEFDQLRTTAGQNKVVNILTNDPTLTLQEAVDQAGYGRSSWLMGATQYAPFGKQYLPEEAIEFSRMRDYTPMELLGDEWFMSNYGDQIRTGFSGQFKGVEETLKGIGESIKDVFTTKPPVNTVSTKQGGGTEGKNPNKEGGEKEKDPNRKYNNTVSPSGKTGYAEIRDENLTTPNPNEGKFIYEYATGGLFQNPILSMLDMAKEVGDEMVQSELNDMFSASTEDILGFNFVPRDENGVVIKITFKGQEGGYSKNQESVFSKYLDMAKDKAVSDTGADAGFFGSAINAAIEAAKKANENKTESTPTEDPVKLTPAQTNASSISSAIDKVAGDNQDLRALLYTTSYMENTFGANPNAYGRDYTHSFMSLDDPAINQIFDIREGATKHTKGQKAIFEMYENLGLPSDKESIIKLLDQDDPLASVATARAYYATVPTALPSAGDSEALFNYFSENYNKGGQSKYQTEDEALDRFNVGYSKLSSQYDFEMGGIIPSQILTSRAGVFDPSYKQGQPVFVPTTQGIITMDGVDTDLVGISDGGEIAYMPANSGKHRFQGKNILEVPADLFYGQDGGLADWFKEEWVRIDTEGNITGPCGTMKKGKSTTRCLPKKKAQSLTKAERKATARKKVRGSKKGKQFVANTKKAKVTKRDTKRG